METFGDWLIEIIEDRGWSQSELARRCHVSHVTISRIITGERKPSIKLCKAIARAIGDKPEEIMRRAGLLDQPKQVPLHQRAIEEIKSLTADDLVDLLKYIAFMKSKYEISGDASSEEKTTSPL